MAIHEKYSRQVAHWGKSGQQKIQESAVFIAGVGGLGTTLCQILTRAGIGKLILCDDSVVDMPDLNRQSLYIEKDLGHPKVDIACKMLRKLNSDTDIDVLNQRIDDGFEMSESISIIADCLDNYPSRIRLYDAAWKNAYYIHGGVDARTGQVGTLLKGASQSMADIFLGVNDQSDIPVTPDVAFLIASVMAKEIFNIITAESQLLNRFWIMSFDDFHTSFLDV